MGLRALAEPCLVLLLLSSPALAGPAGARDPFPATARYERALAASRRTARMDVEALYARALAAAAEIEAAVSRADEATAAGHATKPSFPAPEGLSIQTDEALIVVPVPRYFAPIAEQKGNPVDRAFFALLQATRPDGAWPVYLEQQTDVTGCTRFDWPELPALYSGWLDLQHRHPRAYRGAIAHELDELSRWLLAGDCACGAEASVVRGLETLGAALPGTPVAARITARLEALRAGEAHIRFECHSG